MSYETIAKTEGQNKKFLNVNRKVWMLKHYKLYNEKSNTITTRKEMIEWSKRMGWKHKTKVTKHDAIVSPNKKYEISLPHEKELKEGLRKNIIAQIITYEAEKEKTKNELELLIKDKPTPLMMLIDENYIYEKMFKNKMKLIQIMEHLSGAAEKIEKEKNSKITIKFIGTVVERITSTFENRNIGQTKFDEMISKGKYTEEEVKELKSFFEKNWMFFRKQWKAIYEKYHKINEYHEEEIPKNIEIEKIKYIPKTNELGNKKQRFGTEIENIKKVYREVIILSDDPELKTEEKPLLQVVNI